MKKQKLIVILGPTSSGKTSLAVNLACQFNGEIVSADSRQVYKGMDIGTGKDLAEYKVNIQNSKLQIPNKSKIQNPKSKIVTIPYHLIDVAMPIEEFNLAKYKLLADKAIEDILKWGKVPILVGGSGLYLQAVVDDYKLTKISQDKKLRVELESLSVEELLSRLQLINPKFANKINSSDQKNKRRLIRYIEIQTSEENDIEKSKEQKYSTLILGLNPEREVLKQRIHTRLIHRLEKEGLVDEVKNLHDDGVSWERLEGFGLEYKFISQHLQGKLKYAEMVEKLNIAIVQFSKKQMTWFRRWEKQGRQITWIKDLGEAKKIVEKFLK